MRDMLFGLAIAIGVSLVGLQAQFTQKLEPLLLMDRTGSVFNQAQVESLLASSIARVGGFLGAIRLIAFGDRVLDVPPTRVEWSARGGWQSGFAALSEVQRSRSEKNALGALTTVLGQPGVSAARATNIPGVLVRAGRDGHALLVTDGENQIPHSATVVTDGEMDIVLCAAKSDRSDRELEISEQRRSAIQKWAPKARVFSCSEIDVAVTSWIKALVKSLGRATD